MNAPKRESARGRSAVLWTLQGLVGLMFVYFGVTRYAGGESITQSFDDIGAGQWLRYATGTTEIFGGLALLYLPLAGLAAAALAIQMVGAALVQVAFVDDGSPALPIILGVLAFVIAWQRRSQSAEAMRIARRRHVTVGR